MLVLSTSYNSTYRLIEVPQNPVGSARIRWREVGEAAEKPQELKHMLPTVNCELLQQLLAALSGSRGLK